MNHINRAKVAGALALMATTLLGRPALAQVDISGSWTVRLHEDQWHRQAGPELGDFTGLPINDGARLMANAYDASIWSQRGYQCRPHGMAYAMRGPGNNIRISRQIDDSDGRLVAYAIYGTFGGAIRPIWMDGRPHPPKYARHTWMGFSTGTWVGDMLAVTTTHIKKGYIQRNGVDASDQATVNEYFFRFGEGGQYLTLVSIVHDPISLEEPFIRTIDFGLNLSLGVNITPRGGGGDCGPAETADEIASVSKHHVAHNLPWTTDDQMHEVPLKYGIPLEAAQGGAKTTYPEYMIRLKQLRSESARNTASRPSPGRSTAQTGFIGTWRLDRSKSTFNESERRTGPLGVDARGVEWRTMTFEAAGDGLKHTTDTRTISNDTGFFREEYTAKFDGQDYPIHIKATALDTVSLKRIDANTIERTGKIAGQVTETATWKVSADGRVLTVTIKGKVPGGPEYSSVQVLNRE